MTKKAQFKRVAVAGQTTDGRAISPHWLTQAAKNYNREKYGARVNLEHYLSMFPDSDFRAYGDVLSLRAEEVEIDNVKTMALFAEIDPTEDLIKLTNSRNKVYSSIELDLDFAGTGEAYMVGLAITNTPASLGTEYLQFCAGAGANSPLAARKQKPTNLFSSAIEAEIELVEQAEPGESQSPHLIDKIKAMFASHKKDARGEYAEFTKALEAFAGEVASIDATTQRTLAEQATAITALTAQLDGTTRALEELTARLSSQEDPSSARPPATGAATTPVLTDC